MPNWPFRLVCMSNRWPSVITAIHHHFFPPQAGTSCHEMKMILSNLFWWASQYPLSLIHKKRLELVHLRGKPELKPLPKNEFWYLLGVLLNISDERPCRFYMGVTPEDSTIFQLLDSALLVCDTKKCCCQFCLFADNTLFVNWNSYTKISIQSIIPIRIRIALTINS